MNNSSFEDFLDGIVAVLIAIGLMSFFNWNKVVLDNQYIIVDMVKSHSKEDKTHPYKYKIVGDGILNWVDFYTDSVYKPGDTLYLSPKKP